MLLELWLKRLIYFPCHSFSFSWRWFHHLFWCSALTHKASQVCDLRSSTQISKRWAISSVSTDSWHSPGIYKYIIYGWMVSKPSVLGQRKLARCLLPSLHDNHFLNLFLSPVVSFILRTTANQVWHFGALPPAPQRRRPSLSLARWVVKPRFRR